MLLNVAQARRLFQVIAASVQGGNDIRRIDLASLKTDIDLAEQSLAELRQFVARDPEIGERVYGLGKSGALRGFIDNSYKFLAEAKYLYRSVRDRQPMDIQLFTVGDLLYRFDNMVYTSNQLRL